MGANKMQVINPKTHLQPIDLPPGLVELLEFLFYMYILIKLLHEFINMLKIRFFKIKYFFLNT